MQYLLEITDERKKDFLLELLANLDFVRVKPQSIEEPLSADYELSGAQESRPHNCESGPEDKDYDVSESEEEEEDHAGDFLASAGMFSHWTITAEELRRKAWGGRGVK